MFEILKLLHVLGWSAWFGLAIAEASVGVQTRKADPATRVALARLWVRVGRIGAVTTVVAVIFGLALFAYELSTFPDGGGAYMRDPGHRFVHVMLALGLVAGALALAAAATRSRALDELERNQLDAFMAAYKRTAMLSGMATLGIVATIAVVYLHTI